MYYIIDGYNLLWDINKNDHDNGGLTDVNMCRFIDRFLTYTGENAQIIFDGIGPPEKTAFDYFKKLEVFFTGQSTDADTVIENKISADTAPKRLTIVSSDRRLQKAGKARKTAITSSQAFWKQVIKQITKRKKKDKEPEQKRNGLSQAETDQWLKLFEIDQ